MRVIQISVLAALFVAWLAHRYPLVDYVIHAQEKIGAMEFWGGVLYPLLYGGCNVLLLPGGVLAIGSGLFFGLWWGFFLNLIGNVGGAAVALAVLGLGHAPALVEEAGDGAHQRADGQRQALLVDELRLRGGAGKRQRRRMVR